jgi:hypothetical protein
LATNDILNYPELQTLLPLDQFMFDGIVIVNIQDVTGTEAMQAVKQVLKHENFLTSAEQVEKFREEIRCLIECPDIQVGITSLFNGNNQFNTPTAEDGVSILLKMFSKTGEITNLLNDLLQRFKQNGSGYLFIPDLKSDDFFKPLSVHEWKSAFIFPLHGSRGIIGSLEIFSRDTLPDPRLVARIEPVVEALEMTMRKNSDHLENEVNKIIKEQFTAVHSSVEWRFAEAASHFFSKLKNGDEARMEPIVFAGIYPLYGAIDIRNSSGQRNRAIQLDLVDQFSWVKKYLHHQKHVISRFCSVKQRRELTI